MMCGVEKLDMNSLASLFTLTLVSRVGITLMIEDVVR